MEGADLMRTPMVMAWVSPHWMSRALCAKPGYKDLNWFPEVTEPPKDRKEWKLHRQHQLSERRKLKEICHACPVMAECRAYAEHVRATTGFWAGQNYNRKLMAQEAG